MAGKGRGEKLLPDFTLVLKDDQGVIVDHMDALLLNNITEQRSITKAARATGISYRNAWDRLDRLRRSLGSKVVSAEVGGKHGGSAVLTTEGQSLLGDYRRMNTYLFGALGDKEFWQHIGYRLSARNRVRARVTDVKLGSIASEVIMRFEAPGRLTSIISNEAVEDLDLSPGDEVEAIIKATEIVLAKPNQGVLGRAVEPLSGRSLAAPRKPRRKGLS